VELVTTGKAKGIAAEAVDVLESPEVRYGDVIAALKWAPSNVLIVIGVGFNEPLLIGLKIVTFQKFLEETMSNSHVALVLRACSRHAVGEALLNLAR
jgi:hypothetical protein